MHACVRVCAYVCGVVCVCVCACACVFDQSTKLRELKALEKQGSQQWRSESSTLRIRVFAAFLLPIPLFIGGIIV